MATFSDGREVWTVEFNGALLGEIRDKAKVDLIDRSGAGYVKLENDEVALISVLQLACAEEMGRRQTKPEAFARGIRRDVIASAVKSIFTAAEEFFPTATWKKISERIETLRATNDSEFEMAGLRAMLDSPVFPADVKELVANKVRETVANSMDLSLVTPPSNQPGQQSE